MNALEEIGWRKAIQFVVLTVFSKLLHLVIFPQLRGFLVKTAGSSIGADSVVMDVSFANLYHYGFGNLILGKRCYIGDEALLDLRGRITLADHVTISNRAIILTHINVGYKDHPLQKQYPMRVLPVEIMEGAYIGSGAIILPGVVVGKSSVVGAGAVVSKNVPDRTVVAGVPAKVIGKLDSKIVRR